LRSADGAEIITVEGLAADDADRTLHPLQAAFKRHFALQCGFCTAGILMAATEYLDETTAGGARPPDEDEVRRLLSGHLCRCTGYEPIVAAIAEVATALQLTGIEPADIEPAETEIDRMPPGGAEPSP